MNIIGEVITNAQRSAAVPKHLKDKPIESAFIDKEALDHFCRKYGKTPPEVLARFFAVDPDTFDEDKRVVLMREQARMALDTIKAYRPKDIDIDVSGDVQVTQIERRIIDPK